MSEHIFDTEDFELTSVVPVVVDGELTKVVSHRDGAPPLIQVLDPELVLVEPPVLINDDNRGTFDIDYDGPY